MSEGDLGKSSGAESQSPGSAVAGSSRLVFISYASHDAAVAQKVCSALEAAGFRCWIAPRNVVPGTMYADGIVHAIDEASILVLILSAQAIASAHVGREIERAVSKRHPVVALRIDTAPLTAAFEYFLNQSQWIEGGGSDAAIAQLVGAVGQHLAPGSPTNVNQASAVHRKVATPRMWVIAAAVVAVLLAGGYILDKAWRPKHETIASTAVISDKSIAVLPFVDMSEKKDQEYFADGMAEEIINLLVKIPGLKVIGRTSSFQFKGQAQDLRAIGTRLGVTYVLEGSVRKSGDHLRVTAQLINSQEGTHLWSQTYDRDLSDVLKMQDEIAASLVRALQVEVGAAYGIVSRPLVRNTEAYNLYLQGSHANDRFDQQGFEQAASYYQRALDLDPTFANAAAGIAAAYDNLGEFLMMPPAVAFEQARHAAEHALTLDPKHAFAHALLGNIHNVYDWDWTAAERELKLARELSPNDSLILYMCGKQLLIVGSWNDALKLVNALLEADPLNPLGYELLKDVQVRRGRLAEAEAAIRRSLEISPTYSFGHYSVGVVLLARGQPEAALAEFSKEPIDGGPIAGSALAYFALGHKADSDSALGQWLKGPSNDFPYSTAAIYAFRGESDEAFKWLDRAYEQKDSLLYRIKVSPEFDKLHGDPRYKVFLKKMNLPE
jgi:TolB-like protein/Tfp pilus assembly protein PilF